MYRECGKCSTNEAIDIEEDVVDKDQVVWWWQWRAVTEDLGGKAIKKTKKIKVCKAIRELEVDYNNAMSKFGKHTFNVKHQQNTCREYRANLNDEELWLHIDFAENYCCKSLSEVQAAHFGGSHAQVSLHTCVAYTGSRKPIAICTMSNNTDHGPQAIWNHLIPVLTDLKREFPVKKLHFMSDGPVTQYRGRGNLHFMANVPFSLGFEEVWWNFTEASHGKGAADGVGAAIKRTADNVVLSGREITDAHSMFTEIKANTSVRVYNIDAKFDAVHLPSAKIPAVLGVMKVHQVYTSEPGILYTRDISCYCHQQEGARGLCLCFDPIKRNVLVAERMEPAVQSESLDAEVTESSVLEPAVQSESLEAEVLEPAMQSESLVADVTESSVLKPEVQSESLEAEVTESSVFEPEVQSESLDAEVRESSVFEPAMQSGSLDAEVTESSVMEPAEQTESSVGEIMLDSWVMVNYSGKDYPGVVRQIGQEDYQVCLLVNRNYSLQINLQYWRSPIHVLTMLDIA
jgi:hypothetical protein